MASLLIALTYAWQSNPRYGCAAVGSIGSLPPTHVEVRATYAVRVLGPRESYPKRRVGWRPRRSLSVIPPSASVRSDHGIGLARGAADGTVHASSTGSVRKHAD